MQLSQPVEWSLHCAWLLGQIPDRTALPGRRLAEFYGLPEPYLAKVLKALTSAGILTAVSGPRGGYRLGRPAGQITVLDIVQATEGSRPVFRCAEIRQRGPFPLPAEECARPCGIAAIMSQAEQAWRDQLAAATVASLIAEASPSSAARAREWLSSIKR
ncbi:MAG: RrF2 family transcriptional regulator [Streptosporangiaceae bacterium]